MAQFNRSRGKGGFNKRGGGNDRFRRGESRFDRNDRGPVEMFSASCDGCHKKCDVPFRPNGSKPVYCSDCFNQSQGGGSSNRGRNERRDVRQSAPRENTHVNIEKYLEAIQKQLQGINEKLEKALTTPVKATKTTKPESKKKVTVKKTKGKKISSAKTTKVTKKK